MSSESKDPPKTKERVVLDGGIKEGGGQVLRNAMAYAALLHYDLNVVNIRAARPKPGLAPQHLTGIELVNSIAHGRLQGNKVGSCEIEFSPRRVAGGTFVADSKTAGSVTLLMQVSMPVMFLAPSESHVTFKGGTCVPFSPSIDYVTQVLLPYLERFGLHAHVRVARRGYYPRGGGVVDVVTAPHGHIRPLHLIERGGITAVHVESFLAGSIPAHVAQRMNKAAEQILRNSLPNNVAIRTTVRQDNAAESTGDATGILIIAETEAGCRLGSSALGERGVPAETVAAKAADALLLDLATGACVDSHMQDQLIVYMALASGPSALRTGPLTLHTETSIAVAQLLTKAKFSVDAVEGVSDAFIISCEGIGYTNSPTAS